MSDMMPDEAEFAVQIFFADQSKDHRDLWATSLKEASDEATALLSKADFSTTSPDGKYIDIFRTSAVVRMRVYKKTKPATQNQASDFRDDGTRYE